MNIEDLGYFMEITQTGSITKASKNTYISPQGLSSALQKMEKELEIKLFDRSPNGVILNEYGRVVLEKSKDILCLYKEMQNEITNLKRQNQGLIKMVSAYGVIRRLTPDFILEFSVEHPEIHLDYMEFPDRYVDQMVEDDNVDIGLAIGPIDQNKLDAKLLFEEELMLLVRKDHRLAKRDRVSFEDVKDIDFIIESNMFKMHSLFVNKCRKYDFDPNILFNTSGYSLCHKLCAQGKGSSITLRSNCKDMINDGLCAIPFKDQLLWSVYLISKKNSVQNDNVDLLKDYIVKWVTQKKDDALNRDI